MPNSNTPDAASYEALLIAHGLSAADACAWSFLRDASDPTSPLVLDVPGEYIAAGIDTSEATNWFLLGINSEHARTYTAHGWTPLHLVKMRKALHAINDRPADNTPADLNLAGLQRQPGESDWMQTSIPPDLTPLYIRAGHTIQAAELLDARRREGDTSIEPALHTLAALRARHPTSTHSNPPETSTR